MSSSEKMRILLDSTYLLPIVGVDVKGIDRTIVILKRLRDEGIAEYYYTLFNILEILGKLSGVRYDIDRVTIGLLSIEEEFKQVNPTLKGWLKALELRSKGHKDLIDLLLYTTSLMHNILFLTRDDRLIRFLENNGEDISIIIHEKELLSRYGRSTPL